MVPPSLSKGLMTESRDSFHQGWSRPASLLEWASDDSALIADLIEVFSTDTDVRIALAASNLLNVRAEAHAVKGGARQVGADAEAQACEELEKVSDKEVRLITTLNVLQVRFERGPRRDGLLLES